jgi:hypothetical protein
MKNKACWNGYVGARSYREDDSLRKDEKEMYWIGCEKTSSLSVKDLVE